MRLGIWLIVSVYFCLGSSVMAEVHGIHVEGSGEVVVVPDIATVSFEVTHRDKDANVAKQHVDKVTGELLKLAKKLGIKKREVTAAVIRLHPVYGRQPNASVQVIEAMQATRGISVELQDLDKVGDLINGAIELGITGVNNIQLDTSRRIELERQALDLAIADAQEEAQHVAQQLQVEIGEISDIRVGGHRSQRVFAESAGVRSLRAQSQPFNPGEMDVRRTVQATFAIKPAS